MLARRSRNGGIVQNFANIVFENDFKEGHITKLAFHYGYFSLAAIFLLFDRSGLLEFRNFFLKYFCEWAFLGLLVL